MCSLALRGVAGVRARDWLAEGMVDEGVTTGVDADPAEGSVGPVLVGLSGAALAVVGLAITFGGSGFKFKRGGRPGPSAGGTEGLVPRVVELPPCMSISGS